MSGTEAIIRRIKDLLKLSNSNVNLNEAISAAGKAQELMVKYNLTMEMVSEATGKKRESKIVDSFRDQHRFMNNFPIEDWHTVLANVLCTASHCGCYVSTVHQDMVPYEASSKPQKVLCAVGYEEDVEFVISMFSWFTIQISVLTLTNGNQFQNEQWREDFRLGAIKKLSIRLAESHKNIENEIANLLLDKSLTSNALATLDSRGAEIQDHMKDMKLNEGKKKVVESPEGLNAFKIGFDKGDEIDLMTEKKIAPELDIKLLS